MATRSLSRVIDIVLGIPLLLAAHRADASGCRPTPAAADRHRARSSLILGLLGWTTAARVIRSSVITAKQQDYVAAARMLGAGNGRIMWRHILPNALAPFIVVLTIALGAFIAAEATLSFLGVGLQCRRASPGASTSPRPAAYMREDCDPAGRARRRSWR